MFPWLTFTQTAGILSALMESPAKQEPSPRKLARFVAAALKDCPEEDRLPLDEFRLVTILAKLPITGEREAMGRVTLDALLFALLANPETEGLGARLLIAAQVHGTVATGRHFIRAFEVMPKKQGWYGDLHEVLTHMRLGPEGTPVAVMTDFKLAYEWEVLGELEKFSLSRWWNERVEKPAWIAWLRALDEAGRYGPRVRYELREKIVTALIRELEASEERRYDPPIPPWHENENRHCDWRNAHIVSALEKLLPTLAGEMKDDLTDIISRHAKPDDIAGAWIRWYELRGDEESIAKLRRIAGTDDRNARAAFAALIRLKADIRGLDLRRFNVRSVAFDSVAIDREQLKYLKGKAVLYGVDLAGENLSGLDLRGIKLLGANLSGCELTRTDFSGAELTQAKLRSTILIGTNFTGALCEETDFTAAILSVEHKADFSGAKFVRTDLRALDLARCVLTGCDLSADLPVESDHDVGWILAPEQLRYLEATGAHVNAFIAGAMNVRGLSLEGLTGPSMRIAQ